MQENNLLDLITIHKLVPTINAVCSKTIIPFETQDDFDIAVYSQTIGSSLYFHDNGEFRLASNGSFDGDIDPLFVGVSEQNDSLYVKCDSILDRDIALCFTNFVLTLVILHNDIKRKVFDFDEGYE